MQRGVTITNPNMQKFGIENLQLLIKFALDTTVDLNEKFKDGKLQFIEQIGLIARLAEGVAIAKLWPLVKKELAELSKAEKIQIRDFVIAEMNITKVTNNKAVDALVKSLLALAVSTFEVLEGVKALKG